MLGAEWESHRSAVFGVAYRLLGDVADAEDVVQDVWLRASEADLSDVRDLRAWLVTVAGRTAYNVLKSARVRRERYVGQWLPAPLLTGPDVADSVVVDESIGTAMLIVMEELTPSERVAFVLHDVFDVPFETIAELLRTSSAAARKQASRARRRLASVQRHPTAGREERERVLAAFLAAARAGDVERLVQLLHPDVVYVADGGGKVVAARVPVTGRERVARLLVKVFTRPDPVDHVEVNGEPGLLSYREGAVAGVDTFDVVDGRVVAVRRVVNPEKLGHI